MRNKNLVDLSILKKKMKEKNIQYDDVGYSKRKDKKYFVKVDRRTIHFGHPDYEDFLLHKDENRRRLYRLRHAKDNINDKYSPGFYSWHVLW